MNNGKYNHRDHERDGRLSVGRATKEVAAGFAIKTDGEQDQNRTCHKRGLQEVVSQFKENRGMFRTDIAVLWHNS